MDKIRYAQIIREFSGKNVAVVGDVLLDHYLYGDASRANPEMPGSPLLRVTAEDYRLGGAGNVAANIAALGGKAILYGVRGADHAGEILSGLCTERGLAYSLIPLRDKTLVKQRLIEREHNNYLARVDFGEQTVTSLSKDDEDEFFGMIADEAFDALVLSDYNKGMLLGGLGQRVLDLAAARGKISIVDPKPMNAYLFRRATVIRPNLREAMQIVGSTYRDTESIARRLQEITESRYSVISCGAEGIVLYDGGFHSIPTHAVEVSDVTGAGDTVAGTLALGLASGAYIIDAVTIANCAAGIVVEKRGTATTSQAELSERIIRDIQ
ncbi:bifunctional hydroxymethylpyrimidine kinase/phosphomethylpyrimidine kinase [Candidatus Pacearchaeota archaeon]|nr:bifunctional hydroxymethylpyrimidine kinase/phosphomethylpyrimidine kinase [Candidatus Pacearchaeota archaeon]